MAALYKHARDGNVIHYILFFPDGTRAKKYRTSRDRRQAVLIHSDAEKLEVLSREMRITKEQIIYALHHNYINEDEAARLAQSKQLKPVCLNDLMIHYEQYARKHWNRRTQKSYLCTTELILDRIGNIPILEPETFQETVEKYVGSLNGSNRTKNIYLDRIRQMIGIGIEKRLLALSVNPAEKIKQKRYLTLF